jgi:sugar-specific transcriptional regulator TrmB
MTSIQKTLENLGLSEKEVRVYLACLELGSASVSEVAEKAGLKRTSVYNFLEEMVGKGFLSEIKRDDQILLTAEDPKVLENKAQKNLASVQSILPELSAMFNQPDNKPKIRFYQGIAGIRKIYEETLKSKEPIYAFSDFEKMMPLMERWMWRYAERRAERGIKFITIAKDGPWARKAEARSEEHMREMKIVKNIEFDTEINIYENKAAILSFERPFAGLIVEDVAIARTLKSVWLMLWSSIK